ncbi:MAG: hypothetical protein HWN66_09470 [Candidatus Helarchaeota archaeon]|nr:hypothetical protein [Candidatus Helarchaeota archaeon]
MITEKEILQILRHDMHKIQIAGAPRHKDALLDTIAQKADATAAWISRNFLRKKFEKELHRKSLIFQERNFKQPRSQISQHRLEAAKFFEESDAKQLHKAIVNSKLLNLYSEARSFPYTSLKYHILLSCALYYNLKNGYQLKDLYLCENFPVESPFQIIYQDEARIWSILPQQKEGMTKVYSKFYTSWECRRKLSFGGDHKIFDELLTTIGSWTTALAAIEDFFQFIKF